MADASIAPVLTQVKVAKRKKPHPLRVVYTNMQQRCTNPKVPSYKHYGGRGIVLCEEWAQDSNAFFAWAIEHGWNEDLRIDRINNDGPYSPSNCRFVTHQDNCRNRRSTRLDADFVRAIRMLRWSGVPEMDVAIMFRINRKQVNEIMRFVLWGDV